MEQWKLWEAIDVPEPEPCSKCGRVIYCGVSKLCNEDVCPKKEK